MMTKEFEESIKPYKEGMELIENQLSEQINQLEGQNIKTEFGTAYRSTVTSFRVSDREQWLAWVVATGHQDMLTNNVAKDAVKEFMERENDGKPPPHLNMTQIYKINVRSPE